MKTTTSNSTTGEGNAQIEQHKMPYRDLPRLTSTEGMAPKLPSHWHDCDIAEKQILDLQRERDELLVALKGLVTRCKDGWIPPEFQGDEFELGWLQACTEFARCKALLVAQAAIAKAEGTISG